MEVALLGPADVLLELIDERVVALEAAYPGDVRAHHAAGDRVCIGRAGQPEHLHVPEAVEGEVRLINLHALALQRVFVGRPHFPQGDLVEGPIVVDQLTVHQFDFVPVIAADLQPRPAGEILAHVQHIAAVLHSVDLDRLQLPHHADGLQHLGLQSTAVGFKLHSLHPGFLRGVHIVAGHVPAGALAGGVIGFALIDAVGGDRPFPGVEPVVGAAVDPFIRAVGIAQCQLTGKGMFSHSHAGGAHVQRLPPIAQGDADGVFAFMEKRGYGIDRVHQGLFRIRVGVLQHRVGAAPAIDRDYIVVAAGDAEVRAAQSLRHLEGRAE